MARRRKNRVEIQHFPRLRSWAERSRQAQLKVRLPESLRFSLEREAASRGHSMNAEIVRRLHESFLARQKTTRLIAETLLQGLDPEIVDEIEQTLNQSHAEDAMAYMADDFREREGDSK